MEASGGGGEPSGWSWSPLDRGSRRHLTPEHNRAHRRCVCACQFGVCQDHSDPSSRRRGLRWSGIPSSATRDPAPAIATGQVVSLPTPCRWIPPSSTTVNSHGLRLLANRACALESSPAALAVWWIPGDRPSASLPADEDYLERATIRSEPPARSQPWRHHARTSLPCEEHHPGPARFSALRPSSEARILLCLESANAATWFAHTLSFCNSIPSKSPPADRDQSRKSHLPP